MSDWIFVRRVLIVFAIGGLAALLWALADIILMVFGGVLMAVVLRALMVPVMRLTGAGETAALAGVVVALIALFAAVTVPFGSVVVEQSRYLIDQLPRAFNTLVQTAGLAATVDTLKGSAIGTLVVGVFQWGTTIVGALAGFVLVLFAGIYFASTPATYRAGFIKLFPERWHDRIAATMEDARFALARWLRAQGLAMVIVGLLTGIGMWLVGVPSPVALGLIAAVTEFVPIVGPIAGAVPALLLASTGSWELVLWAAGVAVVVQQIENNLVMPFLVGRVVELPAAVGLFAVVAIGVVFGPLGLLLGYPLAIVIDVAARRLYVREALGDHVEIPSERLRRKSGRTAGAKA